MIIRHTHILAASEKTTAVVVMYFSPDSIREYLMLRMSRVFWIVSVSRLAYFNVFDAVGVYKTNRILKVF